MSPINPFQFSQNSDSSGRIHEGELEIRSSVMIERLSNDLKAKANIENAYNFSIQNTSPNNNAVVDRNYRNRAPEYAAAAGVVGIHGAEVVNQQPAQAADGLTNIEDANVTELDRLQKLVEISSRPTEETRDQFLRAA